MDAMQVVRPLQLVEQSIVISGKVRSRLQEDCFFNRETIFLEGASTATPSPMFRTAATVGLILIKCSIESVVVGGPGWLSRQIYKGDTIVKIDGEDADESSLQSQLIGTDTPGTGVTLQIKRQQDGELRTVSLKRMPSIIISERLKLFDLFTELKEQDHNAQVTALADKCISAWTDMTSADTQRQENLYSSVMALQNDSSEWLQILDENLRTMQLELRSTAALSTQQKQLYKESVAQLEQTRSKERALQVEILKLQH